MRFRAGTGASSTCTGGSSTGRTGAGSTGGATSTGRRRMAIKGYSKLIDVDVPGIVFLL